MRFLYLLSNFMALEEIGDGILRGKGLARPEQDRVFIPFPVGISEDEAFIARCIQGKLKANGAEKDDPYAVTALLKNNPAQHIEEIGGKFYLRLLDSTKHDEALKMKNELAAAIEVARTTNTTKDQVLSMITTSMPYPSATAKVNIDSNL